MLFSLRFHSLLLSRFFFILSPFSVSPFSFILSSVQLFPHNPFFAMTWTCFDFFTPSNSLSFLFLLMSFPRIITMEAVGGTLSWEKERKNRERERNKREDRRKKKVLFLVGVCFSSTKNIVLNISRFQISFSSFISFSFSFFPPLEKILFSFY